MIKRLEVVLFEDTAFINTWRGKPAKLTSHERGLILDALMKDGTWPNPIRSSRDKVSKV